MSNTLRSFVCLAALAVFAGCGADPQPAKSDATRAGSAADGEVDVGTVDSALRRSTGTPGTPSFSDVTQTSVTVAWSPATRAATYQVQRAPDRAGSPGSFATVASSVTGTSFTDAGLSPATTYWYRVRGRSFLRTGSYSEAARVTTSGGGAARGAPTISSFSASPASISSGGSSTLTWTTSGGTSLSIDHGVGTVTGSSATVSPTGTTTYTLTATNSSGSVSSSVTVTVSVSVSVSVSSGGGGGGTVVQNAYYVAHGGDDGRTKAQAMNIDTPWATLAHALEQLAPGDTLYIRGGKSPDTNTACTGEGAQGGACWTETASNPYGTSSPMYWVGNSLPAGTAGKPITIACYPGETCIIEPASGNRVVQMSAGDGADNRQCSYLTFDGLVFDARHQSGAVDGFRADPPRGDSDDPATMCSYVTIKNSTIRHAGNVGGMHFAGYRWTVQNNHITENGRLGTENCSGGECCDEVHGIYLIGGAYNVFDSNLIDYNVQGVQIYNDIAHSSSGHNTWTNNEIAHNGYNPWNRLTRSGDLGDWGCYSGVCAYDTFRGNRIHDNSRWGVNLGPFGSGSSAIRGVVFQDNHLWNNGTQSNQGCGPSIDLEDPPGSGSSAVTCQGNAGTQP
jgi:hypothetical protein